eukprot:766815-Hanusia_phi.AAC.2
MQHPLTVLSPAFLLSIGLSSKYQPTSLPGPPPMAATLHLSLAHTLCPVPLTLQHQERKLTARASSQQGCKSMMGI